MRENSLLLVALRCGIAPDHIVYSGVAKANDELMAKFKGKAPEVYFVGDCADPKLIAEATATGALTAAKL